jgi:hypothetical protein
MTGATIIIIIIIIIITALAVCIWTHGLGCSAVFTLAQ